MSMGRRETGERTKPFHEAEEDQKHAELFRHMLDVALANGFSSLTDAISRAVNAEAKVEKLYADLKEITGFTAVVLNDVEKRLPQSTRRWKELLALFNERVATEAGQYNGRR